MELLVLHTVHLWGVGVPGRFLGVLCDPWEVLGGFLGSPNHFVMLLAESEENKRRLSVGDLTRPGRRGPANLAEHQKGIKYANQPQSSK